MNNGDGGADLRQVVTRQFLEHNADADCYSHVPNVSQFEHIWPAKKLDMTKERTEEFMNKLRAQNSVSVLFESMLKPAANLNFDIVKEIDGAVLSIGISTDAYQVKTLVFDIVGEKISFVLPNTISGPSPTHGQTQLTFIDFMRDRRRHLDAGDKALATQSWPLCTFGNTCKNKKCSHAHDDSEFCPVFVNTANLGAINLSGLLGCGINVPIATVQMAVKALAVMIELSGLSVITTKIDISSTRVEVTDGISSRVIPSTIQNHSAYLAKNSYVVAIAAAILVADARKGNNWANHIQNSLNREFCRDRPLAELKPKK